MSEWIKTKHRLPKGTHRVLFTDDPHAFTEGGQLRNIWVGTLKQSRHGVLGTIDRGDMLQTVLNVKAWHELPEPPPPKF